MLSGSDEKSGTIEIGEHRAERAVVGLARGHAQLVAAGRQIQRRDRPDAGLRHQVARLLAQLQVQVGAIAIGHLAAEVHRHHRDLEGVGVDVARLLQPEALAFDLHRHGDRRRLVGALERRRLHRHVQARRRQRRVERRANLRRGARRRFGQLLLVLVLGRLVRLAREDIDVLAVDLHLDAADAAVAALVGRVVPEQVVRAAVADDAVVDLREVVAVDRIRAAGFLGERHQAHLRQALFIADVPGIQSERHVLRRRFHVHLVVADADQAAWVDGVIRDVAARGRADRVAHRVEDVAGVTRAGRRAHHVGDVVIDTFAEEQHRLAAAVDRVSSRRDRLRRVSIAERALKARSGSSMSLALSCASVDPAAFSCSTRVR